MRLKSLTQLAIHLLALSALASCQRVQMKGEFFSKVSAPKLTLSKMPSMLRGDADYIVEFAVDTSAATRTTSIEVFLESKDQPNEPAKAPSDNQSGAQPVARASGIPDGSLNGTTVPLLPRLLAKLPPDARQVSWHTPALDMQNVQIHLYIKDTRGNADQQSSLPFAIRQHSPRLTQTFSPPDFTTPLDNALVVYGGVCEKGLDVQITKDGHELESIKCTEGSWSFDTKSKQGVRNAYVFSQKDEVDHVTAISASVAGPHAPTPSPNPSVTPSGTPSPSPSQSPVASPSGSPSPTPDDGGGVPPITLAPTPDPACLAQPVPEQTTPAYVRYPLPSKTKNTSYVCDPVRDAGCTIGSGQGNRCMTIPGWDFPFSAFTGRYLDTRSENWYTQRGFRNADVMGIHASPRRIYLNTLSGVLAYDSSSFFTRLETDEPLVSALTIPVFGTYRIQQPELLLKWDQFFNAEGHDHVGSGTHWITNVQDGSQRLYDLDYDDRGYVYLAYSVFGWGLVQDGFLRGADWMSMGFQAPDPLGNPIPGSSFGPVHILSVKSGTGCVSSTPCYYAIASQQDNLVPQGMSSQLWYVGDTTHLDHTRREDLSFLVRKWAKSADEIRIALVAIDSSGESLRIYSGEELAKGGAPATLMVLAPPRASDGGSFSSLASDGSRFFAVYIKPNEETALYAFTPSAGGYSTSVFPLSVKYAASATLRYGAGLLALSGAETGSDGLGKNVRLFKLNGASPTEVKGPDGRVSRFFSRYYGYRTDGFAGAQIDLHDAVPYRANGKTYLIIGSELGDVWELDSSL